MSNFDESKVNRQASGTSQGSQFANKGHPSNDAIGLAETMEVRLRAGGLREGDMIDLSEVAAQYGSADDQMLADFDYAVVESVDKGEDEGGLLVCTDGGNYLVSSEQVFTTIRSTGMPQVPQSLAHLPLESMKATYLATLLEVNDERLRDEYGDRAGDFEVPDFSEETHAEAELNLRRLLAENERAVGEVLNQGQGADRVASDLALEVDEAGVGFSDRGLGESGKELSEAASRISPYRKDIVLGDDGKLYLE